MGYAGYSPSTCQVKDDLPDVEQALRSLPLHKALACLELMEKLVRNTVSAPKEEKFRKIRLTNAKIAEAITNVPAAVDAMLVMGWQRDGEENLVLPEGTKLVFEKDVKGIINTQDFFKKEVEKEKKRRQQELKVKDPEKEEMRKQLELDRKEREANGPVTQASKAKQIGGNGPNMMRASDLGIGQSKGG